MQHILTETLCPIQKLNEIGIVFKPLPSFYYITVIDDCVIGYHIDVIKNLSYFRQKSLLIVHAVS